MNRLNDQRHLHSIRTAFISTMPIMIIGAYAVVINQLPIPAYQHFMESIFGESWKLFGALAFNATTQILALMVVFLTCLNIANWYNTNYSKQIHGGICGMIGLACYVIVTLPIEGASSLPFSIVGVNGLFVALLVAVIAGESMIRLSSKKAQCNCYQTILIWRFPSHLPPLFPPLL